jgi:hypothetical protein
MQPQLTRKMMVAAEPEHAAFAGTPHCALDFADAIHAVSRHP